MRSRPFGRTGRSVSTAVAGRPPLPDDAMADLAARYERRIKLSVHQRW